LYLRLKHLWIQFFALPCGQVAERVNRFPEGAWKRFSGLFPAVLQCNVSARPIFNQGCEPLFADPMPLPWRQFWAYFHLLFSVLISESQHSRCAHRALPELAGGCRSLPPKKAENRNP
jgi:hypothetical protein